MHTENCVENPQGKTLGSCYNNIKSDSREIDFEDVKWQG
jgi:hypothetical protein